MPKTRKTRGGAFNMKSLLNTAKTYKNTATQKAKNLGQKLKNKYNETSTKMKLNNEFANRPNVAGMRPGAASRNLLAVANAQTKRRQMRNRYNPNGSSGRNAYNVGSMLTGFL
jgi:hypothetical protein